MLAIQVGGWHSTEKELRAIGVRPCIGHGEYAWGVMLVLEVLIPELFPVDRLASSAVASCEVPALAHEARDHSMKRAAFEMQRLARATTPRLPSAQCSEVLSGLGHGVCEKLHNNQATMLATNVHVKINARVGDRGPCEWTWALSSCLCAVFLALSSITHIKLATVRDDHRSPGLPILGTLLLNDLYNIHSLHDPAKDDMLAIQVGGWHSTEKELRAVGVRPRIGHGEYAWGVVLVLEVLIPERFPIDRLASSAVTSCEVAALAHEARDHSVKRATFEMQGLARATTTLLASAQCPEILSSSGDGVCEELHNDHASRAAPNLDLETNQRVWHCDMWERRR